MEKQQADAETSINPNLNSNSIAAADKDEEVGERIDVAGRTATSAAAVDPAIERRLKRKLDLIIIPTMAMTYLFKYDCTSSRRVVIC